MRSLKILHLIHKPQNRGAETFACQLSNHQKNIGHEVKINAIYNGNAKLNWEDAIENLGGQEKKFFDWNAWKKLAEYVKDFQPDIVQANSGDTLKYTVFSKKIFGWKAPVIFRNASEVGQYLNTNFQKKFNSFLYRNVAGVASVSEKSKKDLIYHFSFLEGKTIVIPIGLENKTTITAAKLDPAKNYNIVHVGGFSFEKNHKGLLRIFSEVLHLKPDIDIHLHLIGDGPLRSKIENLTRALRLEQHITFYGFVNNPLDFIKSSDLLVLPSKIEGLPGVLLEAMYCKTPVIAYNVGGISEIVNKTTGSLIEKDNETEFAKAIIKNLKHPNESQITEAHRKVTRKFMNEKLAKEFLEFYHKVIS